jgi:hypothetical protein
MAERIMLVKLWRKAVRWHRVFSSGRSLIIVLIFVVVVIAAATFILEVGRTLVLVSLTLILQRTCQ